MIRRYGIDTSILLRLLTGSPADEYERCRHELSSLVESGNAEVFVSNQVVGEAYISVKHHYRISSSDARAGLLRILTGGLISPLNGQAVITALETAGGPGLFDRLIADDYARSGLEVLTLDRKMAGLPDVNRL